VNLIVVDKPSGPSSFAVLKRVKKALLAAGMSPKDRVGHGGTLDPMASGVLPICLGEGTKVLQFLLDADKEYEAIVRLGVVTDTLDATGQILRQTPVLDVDEAKVRAALARFSGEIEQKPPMFSALKKDGQPLYRYARAGQEIERKLRKVRIHAIDLSAFGAPNLVSFRVRCSKGTYVRTLAADLGDALGVGGHLVSLRRTVSGPFHLGQAITPDDLEARVEAGHPLPYLTPLEALAHLPRIQVDPEQQLALVRGQTGRFADLHGQPLPDGPVVAVAGDPPAIVAILERDGAGGVIIRRGFQPQRSLAK
jgi:tRNA pseudouridine55 synthase